MCVVWSYLDADLVYSGGEDGTVRPWRPSLQQNRQPPVPGTLRIKTELNARPAIRQRADLFEANKISLTQGQRYSERMRIPEDAQLLASSLYEIRKKES